MSTDNAYYVEVKHKNWCCLHFLFWPHIFYRNQHSKVSNVAKVIIIIIILITAIVHAVHESFCSNDEDLDL